MKIANMTHLVKGCTQQYKRYSTYTSTIQPAERLIEGFPFKEFSKLIGRMKICLSYSQQAYQISSRDVHWSQKQRRCELVFFFSFLKRLWDFISTCQISNAVAENTAFSVKRFILKCRFKNWDSQRLRDNKSCTGRASEAISCCDIIVVNRFSYMFSHFEPFPGI